LPAPVTDQYGHVPNTPAWIEYWTEAADRILSGVDAAPTKRIPLAFVDYILAEAAYPDCVQSMV
jgi:hypothetical protein